MPDFESPETSFLESVPYDRTFHDSLAYARRMLQPRIVRESAWPTLAAAAFFAVCAIGFATAAVLAPPVTLTVPTRAAADV
ncbi:MAG: hypothetical protein JO303_19245 [Caulobacteraceae bacterium]|nr:hypothetical protein [Caulobacteraceae bacterium]